MELLLFTGRVLPKTGSRGTVARSAELQGRFHEPSQEFHAYRDRLRFALRFGTAAGPVHATWPWHVVEPNNSPDFHSLRPVDKLRCSGCACLGRRGPQARRASCSMHAEVRSVQLACSCATLCNCAAVPEDVRWSPRPHPYAALARRPGGPRCPGQALSSLAGRPPWVPTRRGRLAVAAPEGLRRTGSSERDTGYSVGERCCEGGKIKICSKGTVQYFVMG